MNQIKIGRFIAECRKKSNLTQMQLAEKLGITDKAISKWERSIQYSRYYLQSTPTVGLVRRSKPLVE